MKREELVLRTEEETINTLSAVFNINILALSSWEALTLTQPIPDTQKILHLSLCIHTTVGKTFQQF